LLLCAEDGGVVRLELLDALIGEGVLGHLLDDLVGHGGDVRTGQRTLGDMDGVADRGRNDPRMDVRVVGEDLADGADKVDARLADVVKTAKG